MEEKDKQISYPKKQVQTASSMYIYYKEQMKNEPKLKKDAETVEFDGLHQVRQATLNPSIENQLHLESNDNMSN